MLCITTVAVTHGEGRDRRLALGGVEKETGLVGLCMILTWRGFGLAGMRGSYEYLLLIL